jgi:hypothetical protein
VIGIDIGGANVKVVTREGVDTIYCPLWEGAPLGEILSRYHIGDDDDTAVVMSGELADCFRTKMEGVAWIVKTVQKVFPKALFYGTDGQFHDSPVPSLAAANWLASAAYLRTRYPDGLLVDMGSTTTDIIPLHSPASLHGLTDLQRLQKGYLLYTGLLRTTIPAIIRSVTLGGSVTPVSAEYFAASADVHLVLGHISEADYICDTPDRKGKDRISCLRRLARVVCADLEEIGEEGAVQIAAAFWDEQRGMIQKAVSRAGDMPGADHILTAGIGSGLLSTTLGGRDLSTDLGPAADALPAHAVREVLRRSRGL